MSCAGIPVVHMSGFGAELRSDQEANPNVIGFLNKPFTSDLLIQTVETYMPNSPEEPEPPQAQTPPSEPGDAEAEFPVEQAPAYPEASEVGSEPVQTGEAPWWTPPPVAAPEPADTVSPYAGEACRGLVASGGKQEPSRRRVLEHEPQHHGNDDQVQVQVGDPEHLAVADRDEQARERPAHLVVLRDVELERAQHLAHPQRGDQRVQQR